MEYELMFLIADSKKEELAKIKSDIDNIVTKAGGTKKGDNIEFERKLMYEIKHNWRGIYVTSRFTTPNKDEKKEDDKDTVAEITRQLNLHKDLLRYIIVDAKELPPLESFVQTSEKAQMEDKKVLKEKGEKIDGKLEKVLNI